MDDSNVFLLVDSNDFTRYSLPDCKIFYSNKKRKLGYVKLIKKIILQDKIDLIFTNRKDDMVLSKIANLFIRKRNRTLNLATFHNSYSWENEKNVKRLARMINICSDGCICLAKFCFTKLSKYGINKHKLLFLPNTVDFTNYFAKNSYELGNPIKIIYTAVINPKKNQLFILQALKNIDKNVEISFAGDFDDLNYVSDLKKYVKKNNLIHNVKLLGKVENNKLIEMLPSFDIYVSPSKNEMSPYNILEAQASGLPVLASAVGGQIDLIVNNVDGILFNLDNMQDFCEKINLLIDSIDLRTALGKNARNVLCNQKSNIEYSKKLFAFIKRLNTIRRRI